MKETVFEHGYKVGDIVCGSNGYNCTTPHFFRIAKVTAKRAVLDELDFYQYSGDRMNGEVMPCLNDDPRKTGIIATIHESDGYGSPYITKNGFFPLCRKWNGKPQWRNCD